MKHFFDVELAERYGIPCAVLLEHIQFWTAKNEANEQNFYGGRYWTYNSIKAFEKLFPYLTKGQIRGALEKLESEGLVLTGFFSEEKRDRTKWYTLSDLGKCILSNLQMDLLKSENGVADQSKCIYISNNNSTDLTDINTDINTDKSISHKEKTYKPINSKGSSDSDGEKPKPHELTEEDAETICAAWDNLGLTGKATLVPYTKRWGNANWLIKNYGLDAILTAINMTEASDVLMGRKKGSKKWKASFDWFLERNNFSKILSGNYSETWESGSSEKEQNQPRTSNPFLQYMYDHGWADSETEGGEAAAGNPFAVHMEDSDDE